MDESKFDVLLKEHRKLVAEFIKLRTQFTRNVQQMREFNHHAKRVIEKSRSVLGKEVKTLDIYD